MLNPPSTQALAFYIVFKGFFTLLNEAQYILLFFFCLNIANLRHGIVQRSVSVPSGLTITIPSSDCCSNKNIAPRLS